MKAIFVQQHSVLRDSHIAPNSPSQSWRLMPATLEAMRMLAGEDTLVFLFGSSRPASEAASSGDKNGLQVLVDQIESGGGRIDGIIACPHSKDDACGCWGETPGILWVVASQFELRLDSCYLLGDSERDVMTAVGAGVRPLVILGRRSIEEVMGYLPRRKDFPLATDLTTAVGYIGVEEEIVRQLGRARDPARTVPPDEILYADVDALPTITITSHLAEGLRARRIRTRAQLGDIGRWLTFFILGAVGLSLGIAYLLTHLYRAQPFPEFIYYVTLQFIPRPLRGALFIVWGVGIIYLGLRSFYRSTRIGRRTHP